MIHIRPAIAADAIHLPAVEQSAAEAFRQIPSLAWIADDDIQPVDRHVKLIGQGTAWVAVDGTESIGFLSAERTGSDLHIWELAVRSEQQGRGVGRALVETACAWAADRNCAAVTLTTFRKVRWNEPFYHGLGFRTLAKRELGPRLARIRAREGTRGLPKNGRCAMRRSLA